MGILYCYFLFIYWTYFWLICCYSQQCSAVLLKNCWKIVAFDNVLRCCGQCVVPDSVIYCIDIILMLCYWLLKMCCWKCCCGVILKYVTVVVLLTNCCWNITDDDMLLLVLLLLYHWGCWGFDVGRGCSLLAFSLFCC